MKLQPRKLSVRFCLPALLLLSGAALAQDRPAPNPEWADAVVIAIPPLSTAKNVDTDAGNTWSIANQIAGLISADLKSTGRFIVADVKDLRIPSYPEVTAPSYAEWRSAGAKLLVSGFVNARSDGRVTIGCYIYDVRAGRELTRQGFAVTPTEWRRAAHRCADAAFVQATGKTPIFDSRIAYIAQSGTADSPVKRLAVMDFDGANHAFLTIGDSTVLTPRWSPKGDRIAYTSFNGGRLHVQIAEVGSKADRPLIPGDGASFAPSFSPDGQSIALSIASAGNTDIFVVDAAGGFPRRLTTSPAIDTSPSYSPDGQHIVFSSDRSGTEQIYVMNADGSNQRRISFGPGDYGSPVWSPDGDHIAFTRVDAVSSRIGVMAANGADEKIVTMGPNDEQPSWSPDGGAVLYQHYNPATRRNSLQIVPASGGEARTLLTPQGASDPAWAERQD